MDPGKFAAFNVLEDENLRQGTSFLGLFCAKQVCMRNLRIKEEDSSSKRDYCHSGGRAMAS